MMKYIQEKYLLLMIILPELHNMENYIIRLLLLKIIKHLLEKNTLGIKIVLEMYQLLKDQFNHKKEIIFNKFDMIIILIL